MPEIMNITLIPYSSTMNPARRDPMPVPAIQQETEPILTVVEMSDCGAMTEQYWIEASMTMQMTASRADNGRNAHGGEE